MNVQDVNALIGEINGARNPAFDVTGDGAVDATDLKSWVKDLKKTWIGDANLDGEFNSSDFVVVFQAGKFELAEQASWHQGDWTGDGLFNSSDFVAAFQDGGFEVGPAPAAASVPEPTRITSYLLMTVFGGFFRRPRGGFKRQGRMPVATATQLGAH